VGPEENYHKEKACGKRRRNSNNNNNNNNIARFPHQEVAKQFHPPEKTHFIYYK
jgi:hypothetical protein